MLLIKKHPLASFFSVAFGFTYLVWLPAVIAGGFANLPAAFMPILQLLAPFGPLVAAVIVVSSEGGKQGLSSYLTRMFRWRTHLIWYVAAFFIPVAAMLLAYANLLSMGEAPAELFSQLNPLTFAIALLIIFFLGGGQEELGWRGFALPRLEKRFGLVGSSLIIGILWALWHLMLWFIPESPQYGVPFYWYLLHMIAFSFLFSYVFKASGSNVLVCMLMHASANAFPALTVLQVAPESFARFFPPLVLVESLLALSLYGLMKSTKKASLTVQIKQPSKG